MKQTPYKLIEKRFERIDTLRSIIHLLRWDAEVMMPLGSNEIRAAQLSLLDLECNSILRSKKTAVLLDRVESTVCNLTDWQQANVREMRRLWIYGNTVPKRLINSLHRAVTKAEVQWRKAVETNNYKTLCPHLERVVDLVREKAHHLAGKLGCSPYDALLDEYDPGRRACEIDPVFDSLKTELPGLIAEAIQWQEGMPVLKINAEIPVARQRELGRAVMKQLGFPFEKGRLDESLHPFTEGTAEDIRITSRFSENDFLSGLMGVLHETGHAMYDFGLPSDWFLQPVGRDRGMTIHESQALLLEMMIGRSRKFFEFAAPLIAETFQASGPAWAPENLFRLATRVRKSFIRMEADEMTYTLHVMMRYEIEKNIFDGTILVKNLPEVWNEKFNEVMGFYPNTLKQGCLQDSHWPQGYFGYFSTYALGAIMASQLYRSIKLEKPEALDQIPRGNFEPLFGWLSDRVYCHGAKLSTQDLVQQATGEGLNGDHYLSYLKEKYLGTS